MQWFTRSRRNALVLILVALAAHGQMLGRGFVSDDWDWLQIGATAQFPDYLTGNYAGLKGVGGSYRPVVTVVMQLMHAMVGLHAFWYHALSLILLVITALGIVRLVDQLLASVRQREWIAWMSALFFVLMPTHAEAVYWVAGLPDMIAAAAMVWSVVFILRNSGWRTVAAAFALWVVALGAKENAVVLPGIWLACTALTAVLEWNRETLRQQWRRQVVVYAGAAAVLIAFLLVRRAALGSDTLSYSMTAVQLSVRSAVLSLLHTAVATVVGWHETRHEIVAWIWNHRAAVAGIGGGACISVTLWFVRRHERRTMALLALIGATILAALPNIAVVFHPVFAEGERFAYFPSVFVAVLLAWVCSMVIGVQRRVGKAVSLCIALSFVIAIPHYHHAWDEADRAFAKVTADLGTVPDGAVVMGLPEFAQRVAPVLRNGLPQYRALTTGMHVERLPVYTQWGESSPMQWVRESNGWQATYAPGTRLWGQDVLRSQSLLVEVWDYDYATQHGGAVAKFVYRPADERTKRYQEGASPPVFAWSSEGFIPMPPASSLK